MFEFSNVQVYSLQKGYGVEQAQHLPPEFNLINIAEAFNDFSDTAAAIENLDLVISVDTSIAHLAGALGKPAWIILPITNDWRWFLEKDTTVWYKSVKLFKSDDNENRELVMQRIFDALKYKLSFP